MSADVNTKNPWPCCPLMSGQSVPAVPPGAVLKPNQMAIATMMVPCAGADCPLFVVLDERCCLGTALISVSHNLAAVHDRVSDLRLIFEPPKGSPSPLMRVAEALEEIIYHLKTKEK